MSAGKVYLVGAGPGDPGLVTVAGLERIRAADVIVYDRLVSPRLLDHARADANYFAVDPWNLRAVGTVATVLVCRLRRAGVRTRGLGGVRIGLLAVRTRLSSVRI